MLELLRKLATCGAIFIEARDRQWWVACEVVVSDGTIRNIVKARGDKLYPTLSNLLLLAKEEKKKLVEKINSPVQQTFEYKVQKY